MGTNEMNFFSALPRWTDADRAEISRMEQAGTLPKKINRSLDLYFKILLGTPSNRALLMDLVNAIFVPLHYDPVTEISFVSTENPPEFVGLRNALLDIRAVDVQGRQINIELQQAGHDYLIQRFLFYLNRMYVNQLRSGGGYGELKPVVGVSLLCFDMFREKEHAGRSVWDFVWTNPATGLVLTKVQSLFFIEMQKFRRKMLELHRKMKENPDYQLTLTERLDVWGAYMVNDETGVELVQEVLVKDDVFQQVNAAERKFWANPEYRYYQYMAELDAISEREERDRMVRKAAEDALTQGRTEGLTQGLTQGREEGSVARARGVAAAMHREGDPVEKIARITDEDVEVIRSWIREFEAGQDA